MADDSVIKALRTWLHTYSGIPAKTPVFIESLSSKPTQYGVFPVAGERVIQRYIDYGSLREYPFAIRSMEYTADDDNRAEHNKFYEDLADWFDAQTLADALPTMPNVKQSAVAVEAVSWGYIMDEGGSQTGVYQLLAKLTFEQKP